MKWRENIIAIDGPAGAGKSTVAKIVARRLNFEYLDSGAIYRALTYYLLKNKVDITNTEEVIKNIQEVDIQISEGRYYVQGEDVTNFLRRKDVTEFVPKVAKIPDVRKKLLSIQHKAAEKQNIVIDGRDIGSVVFPDAAFKFFITATIDERARRRLKEIGKDIPLEKIKEEIRQRDEEDRNRSVSPLIEPEDAVYIDTTKLSVEQVVSKILYFYDFYFFVKNRKYLFYKFTYYTLKPLFKLFWQLKINNADILKKQDQVFLIAPNHLSNLDPLLIGFLNPRPVYFMAKKELFENKFFGFVIKRLYTALPVKRGIIDRNAINHIITVAKAGFSIVIFPEGTRSRTGKLQKGRAGFGMIAKRLKLPILPVRIYGTDRAMPPGSVFPVFCNITMNVGEVIPPEKFEKVENSKQGFKKISDMVIEKLWKL